MVLGTELTLAVSPSRRRIAVSHWGREGVGTQEAFLWQTGASGKDEGPPHPGTPGQFTEWGSCASRCSSQRRRQHRSLLATRQDNVTIVDEVGVNPFSHIIHQLGMEKRSTITPRHDLLKLLSARLAILMRFGRATLPLTVDLTGPGLLDFWEFRHTPVYDFSARSCSIISSIHAFRQDASSTTTTTSSISNQLKPWWVFV